MTSKLVLGRSSQMFNRMKQFKVFIDGQEVGRIKNDSTEEYELPAGMHTVQCKVNWMSSPVINFELKPGTNTYLRISNGMKYFLPFYILLLAGLLFPFYFRILKDHIPAYVEYVRIGLVFPAVIYYALYLTILRRRFLEITEDKSNPFA